MECHNRYGELMTKQEMKLALEDAKHILSKNKFKVLNIAFQFRVWKLKDYLRNKKYRSVIK